MKLSVSNIAWDSSELALHLKLLKDLNCDGVEIAPSCIWREPTDAVDKEIEYLKKLVSKYNLVIPAFHALLYSRPDLYLFGEKSGRNEIASYLKKIIKLAGGLSVGILVYGSPKSRQVKNKSYSECYSIAVDVFRELANEALLHDTCLCIEPLGPNESNFIQYAEEGYRLVKDVNSSGFGLHLDTRAMADAQEDFKTVFQKYGKVLKHFHISEPGFVPPGYTGLDHSAIGIALSSSSYKDFISIEMKKGFGDTREIIKSAIAYARKNYFMINC